MRRQDFIDNVTTWSELISFCYDEDCDVCEDIYSEEARDEDVDNNLVERARNHTWQELLDILEDIPTGGSYYYSDDWGDWHEADDDMFEDRKQDVIDWMDDNDYWDEEEDEDDEEFLDEMPFPEEDEIEEDEDLEPIEDEDISFTDLLTSCSQKLKTIEDTQEQEAQEEAENFDSFVMSFTVTEERR